VVKETLTIAISKQTILRFVMQILINGLISGSAISVLALAFQSVYLPTRVFFIGLFRRGFQMAPEATNLFPEAEYS
jgi:hypothetical protein